MNLLQSTRKISNQTPSGSREPAFQSKTGRRARFCMAAAPALLLAVACSESSTPGTSGPGGSGGAATGSGGSSGASTGGTAGTVGGSGGSGTAGAGTNAGGTSGTSGTGAGGMGGKGGSTGAGGTAGSGVGGASGAAGGGAAGTGGNTGGAGGATDASIDVTDAGSKDASSDVVRDTSVPDSSDDSGSTGCGSSTWTAGDRTGTISFGGQSRTYSLHIPAGYTSTAPVPLVFDFHGLGSTAAQEKSSSGWLAVSNQNGFVLVHPQGVGNSWNLMSGAGGCCPPAFDQNIDDVGFVRALIDKLKSEGCVDLKRIYASGMSNGGGMTLRLACEAADVIAAFAPYSFDLIQNQICTPSRPVAMITYRGTSDPLVPYAGGTTTIPGDTRQVTFLGATQTFEKIRTLNACTGTPQATHSNCSTYSACGAGVETTLCTAQNGGHSPGDSSVAWSVLKNYALP